MHAEYVHACMHACIAMHGTRSKQASEQLERQRSVMMYD